MPKFDIYQKSALASQFSRLGEIDQIVTTGTDGVRDQMAALIASKWFFDNGPGIVEFRNSVGQVLLRFTRDALE